MPTAPFHSFLRPALGLRKPSDALSTVQYCNSTGPCRSMRAHWWDSVPSAEVRGCGALVLESCGKRSLAECASEYPLGTVGVYCKAAILGWTEPHLGHSHVFMYSGIRDQAGSHPCTVGCNEGSCRTNVCAPLLITGKHPTLICTTETGLWHRTNICAWLSHSIREGRCLHKSWNRTTKAI